MKNNDKALYHIQLTNISDGIPGASLPDQNLMSIEFIIADRDPTFLFPPSVQDWLPQGQFARFVVDIVNQIEHSSLRETYAGKGS